MNVKITTFVNPFSFFCLPENDAKVIKLDDKWVPSNRRSKFNNDVDIAHGQYVAVKWQSKWARGVVSMESQLLIWLIDYGFYIRPSDKNVCIDLPLEHRHHPTKVFEAGIHGVLPVTKILTEDLEINYVSCSYWEQGSIKRVQELLSTANSVFFVPVTILTTKINDIVLGDLFLDIPGMGYVNVIDELLNWPMCLNRDRKSYIDELPGLYTTRRKHRGNVAKPVFPNIELPSINHQCTLDEYNEICENSLQFEPDSKSDCGSTVLCVEHIKKKKVAGLKLTAEEIEKYSQMHIQVRGKQLNVLNVLLNKIRDLNMCERYKDYDKKSLGRACRRKVNENLHR